ncbi:MAG: MarR family winged helix-turn-helix transcriptional regulator [Lachnospiraceae bacterium]|nr:MarR family winged helix-turn-helix transcriptional regulator [Lachnospiraceae bacterium]
MKLEWMETHRSLIEKMIRCGNIYAYTFHKQRSFGTESMFSVSQIQTLEYIIETEESDEKMSDMARRLGVSKATFSKNVNSLMEKGLLEKFHCEGNQKNIYVKPTDQGRKVYQEYTTFILNDMFNDFLDKANQIPPEYLKLVEDMMDHLMERMLVYQKGDQEEEKEKRFIKIES